VKLVKLQSADGPVYVNPEQVASIQPALTPSHILARQKQLGVPPVDNGCVCVTTGTTTLLILGTMESVYAELAHVEDEYYDHGEAYDEARGKL